MKTLPLVDERDTVIGYKVRSNIDFEHDIFRTASLWITNCKGEVLLAQRKFNKKVDPGKWAEAVGGTVENDDSYEVTIVREAEEELGITGVTFTVGPKQYIDSPARYFVQWYVVQLDWDINDFRAQAEEVEQIAWVPRAQLDRELREDPGKYIVAMQDIVNLLS